MKINFCFKLYYSTDSISQYQRKVSDTLKREKSESFDKLLRVLF